MFQCYESFPEPRDFLASESSRLARHWQLCPPSKKGIGPGSAEWQLADYLILALSTV